MKKRILTAKEVREATGLARTTVWRLEKDGRFPPRVQLSDRRVGWRADDVEQWARNRPASSNPDPMRK